MIQAIIPGEPVEWIDPDDKDGEPTVWKLRNLSIKQEQFMQKLALNLTKNSKNKEEKTLESMSICINLGLIGADNFKDRNGKEGEFIRDEKAVDVYEGIKPFTSETLQQIPYDTREKMYIYIISGYRKIKGEDSKN